MSSRQPSDTTVGIVGGGLAGLAAAVAACQRGLRVELFEQAPLLGGRAGSFHDPQSGGLVDFCPHVTLGCCTSLADFCRRTGVADCFERHRELHFLGPDGRQYDVAASRWLPAPLHLLPGLLSLGYLSRREKWRIARAMAALGVSRPADDRETAASWLKRHGQSDRAIERFWSVVLLSALGDTVDRLSAAAARKVCVDGFLASRHGHELYLLRLTLGEIWRRVGAWLAQQGACVRLGARVAGIEGDSSGATGIRLHDGSRRTFDYLVVAVPWMRLGRLFSQPLMEAVPSLQSARNIPCSPITAAHLWFDRPITPLRHAAIVGRLSQWMFYHSPAEPRAAAHHYQVVVSASRAMAGRPRAEIIEEVLADVRALWPAAHDARLVHWRVVTRPAAVFSLQPGVEQLRPPQRTPVPNLVLAGDWTATGWPATMEGAVRSGFLAAEAVLRSAMP